MTSNTVALKADAKAWLPIQYFVILALSRIRHFTATEPLPLLVVHPGCTSVWNFTVCMS